MVQRVRDTYRHGIPRFRNHTLEQPAAADWRCRLGVCGMEVERARDHPELPATVRHHHTGTDISMAEMTLPKRVFMIGVPGSRWSGIAQNIEDNIAGFNTSDRTPDKAYHHHAFSGHLGAYFGTGWEYDTGLDPANLDRAYSSTAGTRIHKSHEWAYHLDEIHEKYPEDWIMLVYRPDLSAYAWWHEAGGFEIKYPDYHPYYRDSINMLAEIQRMNQAIFAFSQRHDLAWHHISSSWIEATFGRAVEPTVRLADTLVCCLKPQT